MGSCIYGLLHVDTVSNFYLFIDLFYFILFFQSFNATRRDDEGCDTFLLLLHLKYEKKFDPSAVKHAMALCYVTTTLTRELCIIEFSNRFLLYVCK